MNIFINEHLVHCNNLYWHERSWMDDITFNILKSINYSKGNRYRYISRQPAFSALRWMFWWMSSLSKKACNASLCSLLAQLQKIGENCTVELFTSHDSTNSCNCSIHSSHKKENSTTELSWWLIQLISHC